MTRNRALTDHSPFHWLLPGALLALVACSGGGGDLGPVGGGGGGGGGSNGTGNPLDVALEFSVANTSTVERTETVRIRVPFPRAGYFTLANLIVSGHRTAWLPMQYWDDGSIKLAQAQFTATLPPGAIVDHSIARDETAMTGPFTRNEWISSAGAGLQIGAEVQDTFTVRYRSVAAGPGEILQETPLVLVQRWRTYHQPISGSGVGRDYLTSTFYTTEFADMPFVLVDWILGNDYLGADDVPAGNTDPNLRPMGALDVKDARFLCKGMTGVAAYRAEQEDIGAATTHTDGFTAFPVMQDTFLDDGQTRRYRFLLRVAPAGADPVAVARWHDGADAMLSDPLYPLAKHSTWLETAAAGLLGGPIAGPADSRERAEAEYLAWEDGNHFGTWEPHGDEKWTATTGTPRNHPLSPELGHAIQGQYHRLLQKLEQKAWIQAVRPYHLFGLTVGADQDILLWDGIPIYPGSRDLSHESLGRRALYANDPYTAYRTFREGQQRAHGYAHFDHEHFSADLLFDYWCISGDAWAKEDLRQLGESIKGTLRLHGYVTERVQPMRAEGWCMQAFAQVYQATQDEAMKQYALRRVHEVIEVGRHHEHPSKAMYFQSNYSGSLFPFDHKFLYVYQGGAVLYGYLGAYKAFGDPTLLAIAEDVVPALDYALVTNHNDPVLGYVAAGLRYYTPVEHNGQLVPANYWDNTAGIGVRFGSTALGGPNTFLIGGLYHLAQLTDDPAVAQRAEYFGDLICGTLDDDARWNKWDYCMPAAFAAP